MLKMDTKNKKKTVRVAVFFLCCEKKFFELDALMGNTFKENREILGRKVLKTKIQYDTLLLNHRIIQRNGGIKMAKQMGWTNPIPAGERTFLSMREVGRYTGISYDLVRKYVKDKEFEDYITVGKQNKVMVDRVAFENFIKSKKHIEK